MRFGVDVDEDTVCGESLGTVAGDCVAMIEMPKSGRIEINLPAAVETDRKQSILSDPVERTQLPIGDAESLVWRGELNPAAHREVLFHFPIHADTGEALRVIGHSLT